MRQPRRHWLIASVGLGVAVASGAAVFRSGEVPEPYATSADLPPIPESRTNGWKLVSRSWSDRALEVHPDAMMALIGTQDEEASFEARWGTVTENADKIRRSAAATEQQDALEAWHRAAASEQFADGCRADEQLACHAFEIFKLHQLALVEVLGFAVDGQWAAADARLADAVFADQRFLASCRNPMSCLVSASMLADSLSVTALVLRAQPPAAATDGRERLAAVVIRSEDGDPAERDFADFEVKRRAFVGDYLHSRHLLARVEDEGLELLVGDSQWPPSISFNPEHTAKLIDDLHLDLRPRHGMRLMMTGREEDAEPTRCGWMDQITNAIGCASFNPESARDAHDSTMESIDESLGVGRRWFRRIQELSPRAEVLDTP